MPAERTIRRATPLVGGGVALVEQSEHSVVDGLEGRDDKDEPAPRELGPDGAVAEDVLDLDGGVEGDAGWAAWSALATSSAWRGRLRKSGIGEADVAGAGRHDLVDVGENRRHRDRAGTPPVDAGHRAVPAAVVAATAGLDARRSDRFVAAVRKQV